MFSVTKTGENQLDIAISGSLDSIEMKVSLDELIAQSQDMTNGRMMYEITDFEMPTLSALGVEVAYIPRLFALLTKFDKCAVLCDTAWLRTAAEVEGAVLPGIEIKAFELDKAEEAQAWLDADEPA